MHDVPWILRAPARVHAHVDVYVRVYMHSVRVYMYGHSMRFYLCNVRAVMCAFIFIHSARCRMRICGCIRVYMHPYANACCDPMNARVQLHEVHVHVHAHPHAPYGNGQLQAHVHRGANTARTGAADAQCMTCPGYCAHLRVCMRM